jgi:hypothetical protein
VASDVSPSLALANGQSLYYTRDLRIYKFMFVASSHGIHPASSERATSSGPISIRSAHSSAVKHLLLWPECNVTCASSNHSSGSPENNTSWSCRRRTPEVSVFPGPRISHTEERLTTKRRDYHQLEVERAYQSHPSPPSPSKFPLTTRTKVQLRHASPHHRVASSPARSRTTQGFFPFHSCTKD